MRKIYESQFNGYDESASKVHVYAIESQDEYWEFSDMTHDERCEYFNVFDDSGSLGVMPGALYHTYCFDYTTHHVIVHETIAYNV